MSESQKRNILPVRVFYSYAQEDESLCQILEKHLSLLRQEEKIVEWSRRKIAPGKDSAQEIDENLLSASLILLLISPDFLASDYCYGRDMQRALERYKSGAAQVIPLLLRPVDWEKAPFSHLQYLPRNAQPITLWSDKDEAFQVVVRDIRQIIETILATTETPRIAPGSLDQQSFTKPNPEETSSITASTNSRHFLYKYDAHADNVLSVAWAPDSTRIASGGSDNIVHVWQAATGQYLLTYRHPKDFLPKTIRIVRWSPDGRFIASAGHNSATIYVWDALSGKTVMTYTGHSFVLPAIYSLTWSPDGRFIASANFAIFEALAHVWEAISGKLILKIKVPRIVNGGSSGMVAWSPDGTRIVAYYGKKTYICHAKTGKILLTFDYHGELVFPISWSSDNQWIVSYGVQKIIVWNAITGTVLLSYERHIGTIRELALSPDGKYVASASEDRTVHVWELLTGKQRLIYTGHSDHVTAVTWSPDSTRIASASADKSVHIWRTLLDD